MTESGSEGVQEAVDSIEKGGTIYLYASYELGMVHVLIKTILIFKNCYSVK